MSIQIHVLLITGIPVAYTPDTLDAVEWASQDENREHVAVSSLEKKVEWSIDGKPSLTPAEVKTKLAVTEIQP